MSAFSAIDLARLPAPDLVETLDYEAIFAAARSDLAAQWPEFDALVESEPAVKVLQAFAYRELLLRQRINDAARQTMLAFATGGNLDHIAALFGVARLVATPADPDAVPPVAAVMEDDARLRARVQLAPEAATGAGTAGSYAAHAYAADVRVADVSVTSPYPGKVDVHLISTEGDGVAPAELVDLVWTRLRSDEVRALCDTVSVFPAVVVPYAVEARLQMRDGAGAEAALAAAADALEAWTAAQFRIGRGVARSGLYAALHVEGVARVILDAPVADVAVGPAEVARPTALSVGLADA